MGDLGRMGVSMRDVVQALNRLAAAPPDRIEPWMSDRAHEAGLSAVAGATAPGARAEPTVSGETAHAAGLSAVDAEMDRASTEAFRDKMMAAKSAKRARTAGEAAVGEAADAESAKQAKALEAEMTKAWQERMAFDRATKGMTEQERVRAIIASGQNYPAGYGPREGQLIAGAVGPAAVEGATRPVPMLPAGFYPLTPPGAPFGPQEVTPPGYASSGKRAAHYGRDAVERELDKEPE